MKKAILLLSVLLVAFLTASLCFAADKTFHAKLTGKDQVPTIKTKASGKAEVKMAKGSNDLSYKIEVKNLENVTAAHIHRGKKAENGPPVVTLFSGPKKEGKFSGTLSEGMITDKDLAGDFQGKTVNDLVQLIKSGDAYVNVHTDAHPDGEIRGQLK